MALDTPHIDGNLAGEVTLTPRQTKTQTKARKTFLGELRSVSFSLLKVIAGYLVLAGIVAAVQFPYHSDSTVTHSVPESAAAFYSRIYAPPAARAANAKPIAAASPDQYVATAQETISALGLVQAVKNFVHQFGLEHARVLDVGAGTGYLQDVVDDYVGLDISPEAARFYHKPFIQASATEMPVPDGSFDAIWSVFVLEHVPNPEQALVEMRRTVKNGGLLWLAPAWNCQSWYADGYPVRPFSDLDWKGKIYKAGIPVLEYTPFKMLTVVMSRLALRAGRLGGGPARLHYRPLKANYEKYWMPDSDAVNSLDRDEMRQWFTSRGDECLNCERALWDMSELIIRVHK